MNKNKVKLTIALSIVFIAIFATVYSIIGKSNVRAADGTPTPITFSVVKAYEYQNPEYAEINGFPIDAGILRKQNRFCADMGAGFGKHVLGTSIGWHLTYGNVTYNYFSWNTPNERTWQHYDAGEGAWVDDYYMKFGAADYDPYSVEKFPALFGLNGGLVVNSQSPLYGYYSGDGFPDYLDKETDLGKQTSCSTNWWYSGGHNYRLEWTCATSGSTVTLGPVTDASGAASSSIFNSGTMAFLYACFTQDSGRSHTSDPLQAATWVFMGDASENSVSGYTGTAAAYEGIKDAARKFIDYFRKSHLDANIDITPGENAGSVYSSGDSQIIIGPFNMSDYVEAKDFGLSVGGTLQTRFGDDHKGTIIKGLATLKNETSVKTGVPFTVVNASGGAVSSGDSANGVPASGAESFYIAIDSDDAAGYDELKDIVFTYQRIHASGSTSGYTGKQYTVRFSQSDVQELTGCTYNCSVCRHTGIGFYGRSVVSTHDYWCWEWNNASTRKCANGQVVDTVWYSSVPSGCSADWNCGKVEHTHTSACCSLTEHTHTSACCSLTEHTHTSATYAYTGSWTKVSGADGACNKTYTGAGPNKPDDVKCSKSEHSHGSGCNTSDCSVGYEHTHGTGCNSSACSVGYEHSHSISSCGKKHTCPCNYCTHEYYEGKHTGVACSGATYCEHGHNHLTCCSFKWVFSSASGGVQGAFAEGCTLVNEQVDYTIRVEIPLKTELTIHKYIDKIEHVGVAATTFSGGASTRKPMTEADKVDNPLHTEVGDKVTFKIELENKYRFPLQAQIEDVLPADCELVSRSSSDNKAHNQMKISGTYTQNSTWIDIPAKSTVTITIVVRPLSSCSANTVYENVAKFITENHATYKVRVPSWGSTATHGSHTNGMIINLTQTQDGDAYNVKAYNVSINKYITNVEHAANTATTITTASPGETRRPLTDAARKDRDSASASGALGPVPVEVGDIVTYKIVLYNTNNSDKRDDKQEDITRTDAPYFSPDNIYVNLSDTLPANSKFISAKIGSTSVSSTGTTYTDIEVAAGGTTTIVVKIQLLKATDSILANTVSITKIRNLNRNAPPAAAAADKYCEIKDTLNQSDSKFCTSSDYCIFKKYKVAIEKYVRNVLHVEETGNVAETYGGETGNDSRKRSATVTEAWKQNPDNHVPAEVGDKVTFRVVIYNTVTNHDVFKVEDEDRSKGPYFNPDLTYVKIKDTFPSGSTNHKVTLAGTETVVDLSNPILVPANGKVELDVSCIISANKLNDCNKVEIKSIENINKTATPAIDANVLALNTLQGNDIISEDWYKLKYYNISVNKHIVDVKHQDGTTDGIPAGFGSRNASPWTEDAKNCKEGAVPVEVGDSVFYDIVLYNTTPNGPFDRANLNDSNTRAGSPYYNPDKVYVNLKDTLPPNATFVSAKIGSTSVSSDGINYSSIVVPANDTTTIRVELKANYSSQDFMKNEVEIVKIQDINKKNVFVKNSTPQLNVTIAKTKSADSYKFKYYDISVDKYITNVEHTAEVGTTAGIPAGFGSRNTMDEATKQEKAVPVEVGDTVTYTIDVYNTKNTRPAGYSNIDREGDPYYGPNKVYVNLLDTIPSTSDLAKDSSGNYQITLPAGATYSVSGKNITIENLMVPKDGKSTLTFKVVAKYTANVPVANTADIKDIYNINRALVDKETGTAPADPKLNAAGHKDISKDWYTFKHYSISVEKYVYDVQHVVVERTSEGTSDNTKVADDSRSIQAADPYTEARKQSEPVPIEPGDRVFYKIIVSNTQDSGGFAVGRSGNPYYGPDKVYVDLKDTLPRGTDYSTVVIESIEAKSGNGANTYTYHTPMETANKPQVSSSGTFEIKDLMIPANGTRYIIVSAVMERTDSSSSEANQVDITEVRDINRGYQSTPTNDDYCLVSKTVTDKRLNDSSMTTSRDWHKFKHYNVTVRKFIIDVNHQHDEVSSSWDNTFGVSEERRSLAESVKNQNPVYVEFGDEVTYKIQISNTNGAVDEGVNWAADPYNKPDDIYVDIEDYLPKGSSNVTIENGDGTTLGDSSLYNNVTPGNNGSKVIKSTEVHVAPNSSVDIVVKFTVEDHTKELVVENDAKISRIQNINMCDDPDKCEVYVTADGNKNARDALKYNDATYIISGEWYKLNDYNVSIDKYVYKYNESKEIANNGESARGTANSGLQIYTREDYVAGSDDVLKVSRRGLTDANKKDNPLSVEQGEIITYKIEIKNDAVETAGGIPSGVKPATQIRPDITTEWIEKGLRITSVKAKILKIADDSVVHNNVNATYAVQGDTTEYEGRFVNKYFLTIDKKYILDPGEYLLIEVTAAVDMSNMYIPDLLNRVQIKELGNINTDRLNGDTVRVVVNDQYNEDTKSRNGNLNIAEHISCEYVRLKDLIIAGKVWVDLDRNGLISETNKATEQEQELYGINKDAMKKNLTVKLYRRVADREELVRTTKTDDNGFFTFAKDVHLAYYPSQYTFTRNGTDPLGNNYIAGATYQRVDKASNKDANGNYTANSKYVEYFIEYEYDGVVFKSTIYAGTDNLNADGTYKNNYLIDSNATEFTKERKEFNERYEYISYNSTYGSANGGTATSTLEFDKTGHISQLIERKDVEENNLPTRPMTARSFIKDFDSSYIKTCINMAKNSCGAAQWKQCSNHWKHWETLATLGIINPDDFPNTTAGRKAAQAYLTRIYNSIDSSSAELTQYLWLYKFDPTMDSKTKPATDYLKHINYGLILRENVDVSLSKDVYKVKLTINGEEMEYVFDENPGEGSYGINGDSQLTGDFIIGQDNAYKMELYQSDYQYRVEQYISKAVQEYKSYHGDKSPSELNVEVTFKILVTNKEITEDDGVIMVGDKIKCPKCGREYAQGTRVCTNTSCKSPLDTKLSVKIHEILDLYDENFIKLSFDSDGKVKKIPVKVKDNDGFLIDSTITTIEAWYGNEDKTQGKALTVANNSKFAQKANNFTSDGYNTLYISGMDDTFIDEDNDKPLEIYVKYVLDKHDSKVKVANPEFTGEVDAEGYTPLGRSLKIKDALDKKLSANTDIKDSARGVETIAQIQAYSVWYTADKSPASLVDMDSNAGNIGDTNGKSTDSSLPKTNADNITYYEDTGYKTGINITSEGSENQPDEPNPELPEVSRKIDGYVWDDAKSISIGSGKKVQYIGNGMYKASDSADSNARRNLSASQNIGNDETKDKYIEGAKAEYIEIVEMPDTAGKTRYYEQILMKEKVTWDQDQFSRTGADGRYELKGFIPGYYIVRFTYGDTVDGNASAAKSMQIYNGQDYKSTQFNKSREEINDPDNIVSDLEIENVSDARDDEIRRLEVNSYSEIMFNKKAEILKGLGKGTVDGSETTNSEEDLKELTDNTYMNAETVEFLVRVEKEKVATKTIDYDRSRKYEFKNIDLGIEYRPENEVTLEMSIENIKILSSSKESLVDLNIRTEYNYRREDGTVIPIYHAIDGTNSTGIDFVQFISNTYEKFHEYTQLSAGRYLPNAERAYYGGEDLYTELQQGIANLTMDTDILQGATIIITYKMTAENHSEVDRISQNLNSIRYYYNKATQDMIAKYNGKIAYVYSPKTQDVVAYNSIITAKATGGAVTYLASTTARNAMLIEFYNKDDKGGTLADGRNVGVIYRNAPKTYSSTNDSGYYGRYVGHSYYIGKYGDTASIDRNLDTIAELKVSRIINYIDRNLEYVSDNFTTLENRLWTLIEESDRSDINYKEDEDNLRLLIEKVRKNTGTEKVLKNSNGILYTKLALSFDDRNVDIGDPNENITNATVYNTSLSRFLEPKVLSEGIENNRSKYAGYIYLPLSKVVSAESDANELHFEDSAEIVEYVALNGRRTNFEHTIGDLDPEGDPNAGRPSNGTKEFVEASKEVDSASPESIYVIPPTGLDPNSRLISDIIYTTATVGVPVLGIAIVVVLLLMLIAVIVKKASKKKRIK